MDIMNIVAHSERFNQTDIQNELIASGSAQRNITPSPNFLKILESTGYTINQALKDIIDNSIDAEASNISLTFGSKNKKPHIIISDDGYGMPESILFGALVLGASEPELGDKNKNGGTLGKYGTGLKAALASFKGKTTILTKEQGGLLLKVNYNNDIIQKYWDQHKQWGIDIYIGTSEDEKFFDKETNNSKHGTVIKVCDITRYEYGSITGIKSRIKPDLGKTYRRFIHSGNIVFKVNKTEVGAFDPCGYDIPFEYDNKIFTSELMKEMDFEKLEYIDSNGNKKRDGFLKYRSFLLPQKNVINESVPDNHTSDPTVGKLDINKKLGFSHLQQGISVMRSSREIQSTGWLGLTGLDNHLNRFRVEIDFNGEMDSEWNVDFKKTSVDPSSYILDQIRTQFMVDVARARRVNTKLGKGRTTIPTKFKKITNSFSNFLKRQEKLIPRLPGYRNSRKGDGTGPSREYKGRGVSQKVVFTYRSDMFGTKWYESHTIDTQAKTVEFIMNTKHPMFREYFKNIDKHNGLVWMLHMYTHHFGKEDALANASSVREREILLNHFNTVEDKMGDMLAKFYPLTPKA